MGSIHTLRPSLEEVRTSVLCKIKIPQELKMTSLHKLLTELYIVAFTI